jgi:hypothetical protein
VALFSQYSWALVLVGAGIIVWRLYIIGKRIYNARDVDDWDSKQVRELRARGKDPFQEHAVDFFMGLPDEPACTAVNQQLEREGYRVDVKAVPESVEFPYSLHATKKMRINVEEMQQASRHFAAMALANRGRYDGWSCL